MTRTVESRGQLPDPGFDVGATTANLHTELALRGVAVELDGISLGAHATSHPDCPTARGVFVAGFDPICDRCALCLAHDALVKYSAERRGVRMRQAPHLQDAAEHWQRFVAALRAAAPKGELTFLLGHQEVHMVELERWLRRQMRATVVGLEAPETVLRKRGPGPKPHPLRDTVLRQLHRGGFDPEDMARLVDDGQPRGRAKRYRERIRALEKQRGR